MAIQVDIVTPVRRVLSVKSPIAKIPGFKGEMGVLSQHEAAVTLIDSGVVRVRSPQGEERVAVRSGFAEIGPEHVMLLVEEALTRKQVDKAHVESRLKDVLAKLVAPEVGFDDRKALFKERDWLLACQEL